MENTYVTRHGSQGSTLHNFQYNLWRIEALHRETLFGKYSKPVEESISIKHVFLIFR